jgi:geranylgeranyl pyrophosphate synthase
METRPETAAPDVLAGFAARHLPALEERLAAAVAGLGGPIPAIEDAVALAVGTDGRGGRRWRPLLTLAAARAAGGRAEEALDAAAAVELTHTASLVLDDLPCMDDGDTRRGFPSTHSLVGSGPATLVAVGLLGRAAELLGSAPGDTAGLISAWGRTIGLAGMSGGQVVDVTGDPEARPSPAQRRLHREKTTALCAFAGRAGVLSVGGRAAAAESMERFGRRLGWAYQLADDARDRGEDLQLGRWFVGDRNRLRRGSAYLLGRARRRLQRVPGLDPEGVALLLAVTGAVSGSLGAAGRDLVEAVA